VTQPIVETELTGTRDGITQLQRRWRPADSQSDGFETPRSSVVLVHGIGEHSGRYDNVGRCLASKGHDVLAFDNRGFGQSGGKRGHVESFEDYLDDVEDLVIERRQLRAPVVLIGHSLGGLIAATYVVRHRPAPDLLVLSAPALAAHVPRWQRLAAPLLSRVAPRLFIKNDIDGALLSSIPEVQSAYRDDPLRVRGATARLGKEIFDAMVTTTEAIDRLTIPCYVLHGVDDELVPIAASEPLAALDNVTYRRWPGLRHESFNEAQQDEVLDELSHWLDGALAALPQRSST